MGESVLDRLERLLAEATAKPWHRTVWVTGQVDVSSPAHGTVAVTRVANALSEMPVHVPEAHENAALIVEAVNNLPALIAVARAAQVYRETHSVPDRIKLWDALDALEAE